MDYSRHDFLRAAVAGLPVVCAPWLCSGVAYAGTEARGAYGQAQANKIHNRSTEEGKRRAGEDPEEVKTRAFRRLRQLKAAAR